VEEFLTHAFDAVWRVAPCTFTTMLISSLDASTAAQVDRSAPNRWDQGWRRLSRR
jgi:hypothetical protein